ncbi:secretin N-terminal domain-containing protein [Pseudobythopirellula maris]|nr:secretin N-terminal domain-containing protein [Pseudobythopirellula maris]
MNARRFAFLAVRLLALLAAFGPGRDAMAQPSFGGPARGSTAGQPAASTLEAYPVSQERRATIDQWRRGLRAPQRAVWDERTGQLLLFGPPAVHAEARAMLAAPVAAPVGPADPRQATRMAAPAGEIRLLTLTPEVLHQRLQALGDRPVRASWDRDRRWLSFPVRLGQGGGVNVHAEAGSGVVRLEGAADEVAAWRTVIESIDVAGTQQDAAVRLVATGDEQEGRVRQVLQMLEEGSTRTPAMNAALAQPGPNDQDDAGDESSTLRLAESDGNTESGAAEGGDLAEEEGSLLGPVQTVFVDGLDVILLRGNEQDVERVQRIIEQIQDLSATTTPEIRVYPLRNVDSESIGRVLVKVYAEALQERAGTLSITPLAKPNALLLIGREENVDLAIGLVEQLDLPVESATGFEAFPLKNASATEAKTLIDDFLARPEGEGGDDDAAASLAPRATVVADARSNTLLVNAGPRDMANIRELIRRIDIAGSAAVDEVRVFPLKNSLAEELAEVVRTAITPTSGDDDTGRVGGLRLNAPAGALGDAVKRRLETGVLTGVRVAADNRANALIVTAPADAMDLIQALIEQLDRSPDAQAQLKVFTVANGDAQSLTDMLRALFGEEDDEEGGFGSGGLVRMNFSVDERTNSILAAGTTEDLAVVEAILLKLDDSKVRERNTEVYRLKNAQADVVAEAINQLIQTELQAEDDAQLTISPFERIEREVVVVPDTATNFLIVSSTPRYADRIRRLVDELDERPPLVMIQVMIAELALGNTDEFGVELGLQDSLLFDRSLLSNLETVSTTTQTAGNEQVTTETIVAADLTPGFNFNNQPLGNAGSAQSLATAGTVAAQALSNFALGRVNSELDFGGFVFSASSNSLNFLLRALQETRRLEVLSRPQIVTLDGTEGNVQVGARVPRITSVQNTELGQTNSIVYEDVGIILGVLPRVSPDGQVTMLVNAEKSEVGEEEDGIAISVSATGQVIRAPQIKSTRAQTTVSAMSGQTIVLSGLLTKRTFDVHRRVPILADIPLLGDLFRYDGVEEARTELLIIMTPRVIRNELDAEMLKQVESSRMTWVLGDVVQMHGPSGLRGRCDEWGDGDCEACYPSQMPLEGELMPIDSYQPATPTEPQPTQAPALGFSPVSYDSAVSSQESSAPRRLPLLDGSAPTATRP